MTEFQAVIKAFEDYLQNNKYIYAFVRSISSARVISFDNANIPHIFQKDIISVTWHRIAFIEDYFEPEAFAQGLWHEEKEDLLICAGVACIPQNNKAQEIFVRKNQENINAAAILREERLSDYGIPITLDCTINV